MARELSRAEVELFQAANVNHLGRPLRVDGIIGPETRWALDAQSLCGARRKLLRTAQLHLGLCEMPRGSNCDPLGHIRAWIERCPGARPGDAWCAAWVSWCLSQVLVRPIRLAGALALARAFPKVDRPIAGDLGAFATNDKGNGHVFIVTGTGEREIMGIEGNCGNELRATRRLIERKMSFHRPIADSTGTAPGVVASVRLAPDTTR